MREVALLVQDKIWQVDTGAWVSVIDCLVCDPHTPVYEQKAPIIAEKGYMTQEEAEKLDCGQIRLREGVKLPMGRETFVVDNVLGTGRTMKGCLAALPRAKALVFAVDRHCDLEFLRKRKAKEAVKVKRSKPLKIQ